MKFKLDENFGTRAQQLFIAAGHDVQTVRDEGLGGATDQHLYEVCCSEQRGLVTLDLDFADVLRFPPKPTSGMAIIRVPKNPSLPLLERLIDQLLNRLAETPIETQLWIVEIGRIRVHQPDDGESGGDPE